MPRLKDKTSRNCVLSAACDSCSVGSKGSFVVHWQPLCAELCLTDSWARLVLFSMANHWIREEMSCASHSSNSWSFSYTWFCLKWEGLTGTVGQTITMLPLARKSFYFQLFVYRRVSRPVLLMQYLLVSSVFSWSCAACGFPEAEA